MNKEQTEELIIKIQQRWPNSKISLEFADEWAQALERATILECEEALDAYGVEGKVYPPNVYDLKNRFVRKPRLEASPRELTIGYLADLKNNGKAILAHKCPRGISWREVPLELAERRGWKATISIDGVETKGYMED